MDIGVVGAGNIGGTVARLLAGAGHRVAVSNRRGPESLRELVASIGPNAHAATVDQAARFGDVVVLAVPWRAPSALPSPDAVAGRIVVDAMNPYTETFGVIDTSPSSSSEVTAERLPGSRLVKAFNTMVASTLATAGGKPPGERLVLFLSGDDADAKAVVGGLIEDIGFAPVDLGSLAEGGRRQQPGGDMYRAPTEAELSELKGINDE
jgi:8-hydroxy-5-deazaflavin:NADPH oxidoreductase